MRGAFCGGAAAPELEVQRRPAPPLPSTTPRAASVPRKKPIGTPADSSACAFTLTMAERRASRCSMRLAAASATTGRPSMSMCTQPESSSTRRMCVSVVSTPGGGHVSRLLTASVSGAASSTASAGEGVACAAPDAPCPRERPPRPEPPPRPASPLCVTAASAGDPRQDVRDSASAVTGDATGRTLDTARSAPVPGPRPRTNYPRTPSRR